MMMGGVKGVAGDPKAANRWVACYIPAMMHPVPLADDDEAEARALAAAAAAAEADSRRVPHEKVRAWLLRLADGEFDAPPPELR
jgi:hypothetical protein